MGLCKQQRFGDICVSVSGGSEGDRVYVTIWDTTRKTKNYSHMVSHGFRKNDPTARGLFLSLFGFISGTDEDTQATALMALMDYAQEQEGQSKKFAKDAGKLWRRCVDSLAQVG
jgi:hypothetical protein